MRWRLLTVVESAPEVTQPVTAISVSVAATEARRFNNRAVLPANGCR